MGRENNTSYNLNHIQNLTNSRIRERLTNKGEHHDLR